MPHDPTIPNDDAKEKSARIASILRDMMGLDEDGETSSDQQTNAEASQGHDRPPKPVPLPVIPENIPAELKALKQWLVWNYFWNESRQKWDKPPLDATKSGNAGSSTNAKTWTTFEHALRIQALGNYDGIGPALVASNELVLIDLDKCRDADGHIQPWAQAIIDDMQTYTEVSTGRTGIHLIARGRLPGGGLHVGPVEMYDRKRFVCTTGQHVPGTPLTIEPRQESIDALYQAQRERQASHKAHAEPSPPGAGTSPLMDDDLIIEKALAARNGQKFAALWRGEWDGYPSPSEADLALCRELVYWTEDPEQIKRLFRRSGLMRAKWDEHPSYADRTITVALETPHDRYQGVSAAPNGQPTGDAGEPGQAPDDEQHTSDNGDQPEESAPIHLTDRGNALRLVKAHGRDLHYIYRWKKWLVWDGSRWVIDEGNLIERLAKQVIAQLYLEAKAIIDQLSQDIDQGEMGDAARKIREQKITMATATLKWALKSESAERLSGMLRHARSERGIAITPDQLDANPWLLNCTNGSIDLQTGTLHPHRREDLCMKRLNVAYDPGATCPNWLTFLWRIMGGPKAHEEGNDEGLNGRAERAERLVNFLQRALGYSLTGVIRQQVLFFMYGGGDNGKSTFSETIAALLGEYYQKAPKELLMQKERRDVGGPSPEIARLCGVRLVIASEVGEHHRLNEAQVKDLTGDDTLTARGLYETFFQFRPTHKLWMYGNHKPIVVGTDDAIWKRPKLIPFTEKIPPTEQIGDLRERYLIPELPGILAWAVRGCLDWQKDGGLQVPDEVNAATAAYRREMDAIAAFLEEHCLMGTSYTVKGADLYATYTQWAESGRETVLPRRKFYDQLRVRDCESYSGHANALFWRGIVLKSAEPSSRHG